MNKDRVVGFGIGLLTGAVIGGVVALLLAPQSGEETRKMIGNEATGAIEAVREKTGGVIDTIKQAESEATRRGQASINSLKG